MCLFVAQVAALIRTIVVRRSLSFKRFNFCVLSVGGLKGIFQLSYFIKYLTVWTSFLSDKKRKKRGIIALKSRQTQFAYPGVIKRSVLMRLIIFADGYANLTRGCA